jgi:hypothetical protein
MKIHHLVIALAVTTGTLYAGGMDVKVNKDAVAVSPVDPQGAVTITGPPGCVFGMAPIQIMAQDKKNKMTDTGSVMPDGSFALRLPASPKDSIKLIFAGADGKKKDIKVKVPKGALVIPPPPPGMEIRGETVTIPHGEPIDQGAPGAPPGARGEPLSPPSNDQINRSEKDLNASGMIE